MPRSTRVARHLRARRPRVFRRALISIAVGTVLGLIGIGGSYALWGAVVPVQASEITAGSTQVTVDGAQSADLPQLDAARLMPGMIAVESITVANDGTTPVTATLEDSVLASSRSGLAAALTLSVTPVDDSSECVPSLGGGASARLGHLSVPSGLGSLPPGGKGVLCLALQLDPAAPTSLQGGVLDFVITVNALQGVS